MRLEPWSLLFIGLLFSTLLFVPRSLDAQLCSSLNVTSAFPSITDNSCTGSSPFPPTKDITDEYSYQFQCASMGAPYHSGTLKAPIAGKCGMFLSGFPPAYCRGQIVSVTNFIANGNHMLEAKVEKATIAGVDWVVYWCQPGGNVSFFDGCDAMSCSCPTGYCPEWFEIQRDDCAYPYNDGCPDWWFSVGDCCQEETPIVIDVGGDGFNLTSGDSGVVFDILANGDPRLTSWTSEGSDDAWLVLDRNGNGRIDDATELFGNETPQPESQMANGYLALAVFDSAEQGGNMDGQIGPEDDVYSRLRLWQDRNHDGVSQRSEFLTLRAAGVRAIALEYEKSDWVDLHGNRFRYRALVKPMRSSDVGRWSYDVFLVPGFGAQQGGNRASE